MRKADVALAVCSEKAAKANVDAGKDCIGFAHNVLAVALIRVPGAWLLSNAYSNTLFPMGIASPCGSILSAVICVVAFTVLNRRGAFDKLVA